MTKRRLGKTGLEVTPLGFGGAEVGLTDVEPAAAAKILGGVLDTGINVIDTAECYADSEQKIGAAIGHRRGEYVLITKVGHARGGLLSAEWTPEIVVESVERSLKRLRTDRLDVLLLHSCPVESLRSDELLRALEDARRQGKTRFIGYSGDNLAARVAVDMGVLDVLETSVSFCDQQVLDKWLPAAAKAQMGVVVKRPLANACWRGTKALGEFYAAYAEPYVQRLTKMGLSPQSVGFDGDWAELALRFACFQEGVSTAIVGTTNARHMKKNIEAVKKGPLPAEVMRRIRQLWQEHDDGTWEGQG